MTFFNKNSGLNVFFIGIGGINMSALARYLQCFGFRISGSDKTATSITSVLEKQGIIVYIGHKKENVIGSDVVITTSAVNETNEEVRYALANKIPVIERAKLLQLISERFPFRIGVAGSHGKTTATALIANIFYLAEQKFTSFIGGEDYLLSNYYNSGLDYLISEVCEFRKNIDYFSPSIGVVLNVDNDHLDSYNGFSDLVNTFYSYLDRSATPVINYDDGNLISYPKNAVTFGFDSLADFHAENVRADKSLSFDVYYKNEKLFEASSSLLGRHNVYNILSATAVCYLCGINVKYISKGISLFKGVKRRNEFIGTLSGADVYVDYAHHPKEISALIAAIKEANNDKKLIVVFQPHTYSRTRILFNDFIKAVQTVEQVFIYATYSAREAFDPKYNAKTLSKAIKDSEYFDDFSLLFERLKNCVDENCLVYFVGAGDIAEKAKDKIKDLAK